MLWILQVAVLAILATTEARYRPALGHDAGRLFFAPETESSGLNNGLSSSAEVLMSGNQIYSEDLPKASPSRRKLMISKNPDTQISKSENNININASQEDAMKGDFFNYSIKKKQRQAKALNKLYEDIAAKFPFLVKQGLFDSGSTPSLDHLLSMTVFSQPKMG